MLEVSIIKCLMDNYSYLIKDKETDLVGVVDPSEFKPVDVEINRTYKKLDFILNTHQHFDHIGGNTDIKKNYNSKNVLRKKKKLILFSVFQVLLLFLSLKKLLQIFQTNQAQKRYFLN